MDKKFGTFYGVFIPSILTIFGLVMFMRTGAIIGSIGIYKTLFILAMAESIALTTGLSISAISTNTAVAGGGAYFLISRALGPSFGGSIGLSLFFAQAVSVPFYIMGFSDVFIQIFPWSAKYLLWINLIPLFLIFGITLWNTNFALKSQLLIFIILMLAIASFIFGGLFSIYTNGPLPDNLSANPEYVQNNSLTFYFAIFFPAVTGFLAGVNMSGDLKDPAVSLPRGTIFSILFGFLIYGLQIIITGLCTPNIELVETPFAALKNIALFNTPFLVIAGVFAATLSSALGSLLGAPRIIQAISNDEIFSKSKFFAAGRPHTNDPLRATIFTFLIGLAILIWSSLQPAETTTSHFNPINIMASVVSMFMLFTYALINLAAFVEFVTSNPSFRPKFKWASWHIALYGFLASIIAAMLINFTAALISIVILAILYQYSRRKAMVATFGDARRGFFFNRLRKLTINLNNVPEDPKNWRPRIAAIIGNIEHGKILHFADWLNNGRGLITSVTIIHQKEENDDDILIQRNRMLKMLADYGKENNIEFFPCVIASRNPDSAFNAYLQSLTAMGPLAPNTFIAGWPHNQLRQQPFIRHMQVMITLNYNCIITVNPNIDIPDTGHIDIWWRGQKNGSLMLILAYLLRCNPQFQNHFIRLLRLVTPETENESRAEMQQLIKEARISADIKLLQTDDTFENIFRRTSATASAIFLGFLPPQDNEIDEFFASRNRLLQNMPTTFLIYSNGSADSQK